MIHKGAGARLGTKDGIWNESGTIRVGVVWWAFYHVLSLDIFLFSYLHVSLSFVYVLDLGFILPLWAICCSAAISTAFSVLVVDLLRCYYYCLFLCVALIITPGISFLAF